MRAKLKENLRSELLYRGLILRVANQEHFLFKFEFRLSNQYQGIKADKICDNCGNEGKMFRLKMQGNINKELNVEINRKTFYLR